MIKMSGKSLNNKHMEEFCQKIRFDERNAVLSEIMKYEREDKTLFEIINLIEETLLEQEPYVNGQFRKIARRQVGYYEKGLKKGLQLTKNNGTKCGELFYKKSIEKGD